MEKSVYRANYITKKCGRGKEKKRGEERMKGQNKTLRDDPDPFLPIAAA